MKQIIFVLLASAGSYAFAGQLDCQYLGYYNSFRYGYVQATMTADQSRDIPATAAYEQWTSVDDPNAETQKYNTLPSKIVSMVYIPGQEMRFTLSNDEAFEMVYMHLVGDWFMGERTIIWKKGDHSYDKSIAMCRFK